LSLGWHTNHPDRYFTISQTLGPNKVQINITFILFFLQLRLYNVNIKNFI